MSIASALGLAGARRIRYGFVALGDIAQEAMLPGVAHTGNSEVAALVTSDPVKARELAARYQCRNACGYDGYEALLHSGDIDAVYVATPNWRHAEFVIPALRAGIHVLVEKPLEVSTAKCREILDAARASKAKLMVAYRLHFEPATLATIETIRNGEIGDVLLFNSTFTQMVDPANHRAQHGALAGPILDMGPYPVNAMRYVFEDEPTEIVSAVAVRHPEAGLGDVDDTVAAVVRFPGDRLASFVISYAANALDTFTAVGTKGSVELNPAYMYGKPLTQNLVVGQEKRSRSFRNTDHFGGELHYFSECILEDRDPEPDGEEGYADLRVLEGIMRAIETGASVTLEPFTRTRRIDPRAQLERLRARSSPDLVNASNPGRDMEKVPKN